MILIVSDKVDPATNLVISWLNYYNIKWIRINEQKYFSEYIYFSINKKEIKYSIKKGNFRIEGVEIKVIWFRRPPKSFYTNNLVYLDSDELNHLQLKINKALRRKESILFPLLYILTNNGNTFNLGGPHLFSLNKIQQLIIASDVGLNIPQSIITTDKKDLIEFKKRQGSVITKSLSYSEGFKVGETRYKALTALITDDIIDNMSNSFPSSYFQENIEKEFEIRIFYLSKECYSMAIFSQETIQTQIDFRNYGKIPVRNVPFKLPFAVKQKIIKFMSIIKLNTGSIDLIYSKKGEYVFLEVNPVGQFGMVSYPCNYYLEKIIAKKLMFYEKKKIDR